MINTQWGGMRKSQNNNFLDATERIFKTQLYWCLLTSVSSELTISTIEIQWGKLLIGVVVLIKPHSMTITMGSVYIIIYSSLMLEWKYSCQRPRLPPFN